MDDSAQSINKQFESLQALSEPVSSKPNSTQSGASDDLEQAVTSAVAALVDSEQQNVISQKPASDLIEKDQPRVELNTSLTAANQLAVDQVRMPKKSEPSPDMAAQLKQSDNEAQKLVNNVEAVQSVAKQLSGLPTVSQTQQEQWLNEPLVVSNDWIELFDRLTLTGMSATIFANSLWQQTNERHNFCVSEHYKMLYNEQHLSRLQQAISDSGVSLDKPISVSFAAVTGTPAHYKKQQKIIEQQRALIEFKQFSTVQFLQSTYNADIIEETVCVINQ